VIQFMEGAPAPPSVKPAATPAQAPEKEEALQTRKPMSPLRARIAERLVQAQQTAAILTTFNEADMSAVLEMRRQMQERFQERHGVKLGFMSFFIKAAIDALKMFPVFNSQIDGDDIVTNHFYHIGIAVSTERGLVVPVIRDADRLSFGDLERKIADFSARAQAKTLELSELSGGCFTITNGGVFGSLLSTPILNPPQSGILGMHAVKKRPVVIEDNIVIRPMMYLAVSYDHRLIDGRDAVLFLKRIIETIEAPERLFFEA
jgi:2-oxoglutarate dehydrogenase E2 component (dihydrolipoamide succinyltransferase)